MHRPIARQKVFIRRMIELAGLDYTIIPAGFWPEYYLLEPVGRDGRRRADRCRGPPVATSAASFRTCSRTRRRATRSVPVAATAYCSWDELLDVRERLLGRKVARNYLG